MEKIEYTVTDADNLGIIDDLWRKLTEHHAIKSPYFSEFIAKRTVEQRNRELLGKYDKGNIRIDIARDTARGKPVGYCISTISEDGEGSVQSIFVAEEYRNNKIGEVMMKKTLAWMNDRKVTKKVIAVAFGNEEVFTFYQRHGFYPRATILAQRDEPQRA